MTIKKIVKIILPIILSACILILIFNYVGKPQNKYLSKTKKYTTTTSINTAMANNYEIKTSNYKATKQGVYYEVFVRSFADSNGDGIGDLNGLTKKLDYLNDGNPKTTSDLGVDAIWLMPINTSPSYHKYDVSDYYNIDPEYGTIQDFEKLITQAHKRGIKVIMDLVVNHTSSQNKWFQDSEKSKTNPYRDYYTWVNANQNDYDLNATSSWNSQVWHKYGDSYYYGIFWDQMPDLNYENPKVRREIENIAKFWLKKGADGFRLDAAMHIYGAGELPKSQQKNALTKTLQWWKEFRNACKTVNPNVYLAGEVWDDSTGDEPSVIAPYYKVFDTNFNFTIGQTGTSSIIDMVNMEQDSDFANSLNDIYNKYSKQSANYIDAPFLSNHDQERSMSILNDINKAKLAANIYMTLPGNPFIYYGEELGMKGNKPDENIRQPFIWNKSLKAPVAKWEGLTDNEKTQSEEQQIKDPNSLLNHYKKLIKLRHSYVALMSGDFQPINSGNDYVVAYSRTYKENKKVKQSLVIFHNLSKQKQTVSLKTNAKYKIVFNSTDKKPAIIKGLKITIPVQSTVILSK